MIFGSEHDFLYRQKGQLKLDNTILEEFLPWLVGRAFSDRLQVLGLVMGPTTSFSHLRFDSGLLLPMIGGGMALRSKDHDFALARPLFLRASYDKDFSKPCDVNTHLAYVAVEIKTNFDKTMFQEASGTASSSRCRIPAIFSCGLDMTPINTAVTLIEEVIVLRKARCLPADLRRHFSTAAGRKTHREAFLRHLAEHPFAPEAFERFLSHVERLLGRGGNGPTSWPRFSRQCELPQASTMHFGCRKSMTFRRPSVRRNATDPSAARREAGNSASLGHAC